MPSRLQRNEPARWDFKVSVMLVPWQQEKLLSYWICVNRNHSPWWTNASHPKRLHSRLNQLNDETIELFEGLSSQLTSILIYCFWLRSEGAAETKPKKSVKTGFKEPQTVLTLASLCNMAHHLCVDKLPSHNICHQSGSFVDIDQGRSCCVAIQTSAPQAHSSCSSSHTLTGKMTFLVVFCRPSSRFLTFFIFPTARACPRRLQLCFSRLMCAHPLRLFSVHCCQQQVQY